MRIIFLDIDGVLNTISSCTISFLNHTFDVEPIRILNEIIRLTHANIVISSAWRVGRSLEFLQDIFERNNIIGDIIGLTPSRINGRGDEIQQWINEHPVIESFIIIDDDDFDLQQFQNHIILTDPLIGLHSEHIQQAVNMMNS